MRRQAESIDLDFTLPAPERFLCDEGATADDGDHWVVLIGEGSDAEKTERFLRDLGSE